MPDLSDKARSILTFAAYHRLASGEEVKEVVLDDAKGHKADADGVDELKAAGLLDVEGPRGRFTDDGMGALAKVVEAIRGA